MERYDYYVLSEGEKTKVVFDEMEKRINKKIFLAEQEMKDNESYLEFLSSYNLIKNKTKEYLMQKGTPVPSETEDVYEFRGVKINLSSEETIKNKRVKIYGFFEGILQLRKKAGIKSDELRKPILEGWLLHDILPDVNNRKGMYQYCYLLGMSLEDVVEFFIKGFLTRPFNFKNLEDACYFFGFNSGMTYREVKELINDIAKFRETNSCEPMEENTIVLGEALGNLEYEDFVSYMKSHIYDKNNVEAIRKLVDLKEKILGKYTCIRENKSMLVSFNFKKDAEYGSNNDLFSMIFGVWTQASEQSEYRLGISHLPNKVLTNFPNPSALSKVLNKKNNTSQYETIRKMLILLFFFNYYADHELGMQNKGPKVQKSYEEFIMKLEELLIDCGYGPLYYRNPYDWLIVYCAKRNRPIVEFQNYMRKNYFEEVEAAKRENGELSVVSKEELEARLEKVTIEKKGKKEKRGDSKELSDTKKRELELARQRFASGDYEKEREEDWLLCEKLRNAKGDEKQDISYKMQEKYYEKIERLISKQVHKNTLLEDRVRDNLMDNFSDIMLGYDLTKGSFLTYISKCIKNSIGKLSKKGKGDYVEVQYEDEWMRENIEQGEPDKQFLNENETFDEWLAQVSDLSDLEAIVGEMESRRYDIKEIACRLKMSEEKVKGILFYIRDKRILQHDS